jgi:zinc and cadmium transporter
MNTWLVISVLFGSVSIVGILTLIFESFFSKIKQYVTTIGVSFVLSLICIHILPELFANNAPNLGVYILIGFLIQIILELFSRGIEHGHVHGHEHNHEGGVAITNKVIYTLFFGLCAHAFIEGIPLFILEEANHHGHTHAHATQGALSTKFFWAIFSHKIPVAIVLMLFFISAKIKKSTALILFFTFAFMTPLGGLTGTFLQDQNWFDSLSVNLLAITSGMLLHITTLLIFEEYHNNKDKVKNIFLIIGGILLGLIIFS